MVEFERAPDIVVIVVKLVGITNLLTRSKEERKGKESKVK